MTDNRTTELRGKLTERGIEYTTNDHMGACETSWNGFTATQLSPNANLIMAVTPEQAIAATLGSEREKRLEKLVQDMWREITTCPDYRVPPCMTNSICERVRNLRIEVSDDGR